MAQRKKLNGMKLPMGKEEKPYKSAITILKPNTTDTTNTNTNSNPNSNTISPPKRIYFTGFENFVTLYDPTPYPPCALGCVFYLDGDIPTKGLIDKLQALCNQEIKLRSKLVRDHDESHQNTHHSSGSWWKKYTPNWCYWEEINNFDAAKNVSEIYLVIKINIILYLLISFFYYSFDLI